jgi:DNA-binding Lrp family transcriptional regulator
MGRRPQRRKRWRYGLSSGRVFAGLRLACPAARARPCPREPQPPDKEMRMIPFFVQIKCQLGRSYEVAAALADAEIASEIYSTAGEFDLMVKFYVEAGVDIGHFVNEKVQRLPGIQDTRTIITFKAF